MFNAKTDEFDALQTEINSLFSALAGFDSESDEYDKITNQIVKLKRLQAELNQSSSWRPSPDALLSAAASIVGILAILNYERFDSVMSKALPFVTKPR